MIRSALRRLALPATAAATTTAAASCAAASESPSAATAASCAAESPSAAAAASTSAVEAELGRRFHREAPPAESPAAFDVAHYGLNPQGCCAINSNFLERLTDDDDWTIGTFADKATGKFESAELRDIARALPELLELLRRQLAALGAARAAGSNAPLRVADVGAGTGLFLEGLTQAVGPGGWVYACERSQAFVRHLQGRVDAEGLGGRCSAVQTTDESCRLPMGSTDLVLLCDVYHHVSLPKTLLESVHKSCKSGARLVLIDFHREPERFNYPESSHFKDQDWVLGHVRAGREEFTAEIESFGFHLIESHNVSSLRENYVLVFERV